MFVLLPVSLLDQEMCRAQSGSEIFLCFFTARQFAGPRNVLSPFWGRNFSKCWPYQFGSEILSFLLLVSWLDQEMCKATSAHQCAKPNLDKKILSFFTASQFAWIKKCAMLHRHINVSSPIWIRFFLSFFNCKSVCKDQVMCNATSAHQGVICSKNKFGHQVAPLNLIF